MCKMLLFQHLGLVRGLEELAKQENVRAAFEECSPVRIRVPALHPQRPQSLCHQIWWAQFLPGGMPELFAALGHQFVALFVVARHTSCHDILPHMLASTRDGDHMIDGSGLAAAVRAQPSVPAENILCAD